MNNDPIFDSFVSSRDRLLEQSAIARNELSDWIEQHRSLDANITHLAQLEGLLSERKQILAQLIELDDKLMDHLIAKLNKPSVST